ncbi:outer membrane beta-barrel family protein [Flavobacterium nitrogenifigens]|uniref:Outer membrane receptor proteins, mostly Fe transport n=1 Tax=Flavobacterium nitrogenifigens TaxID=1617283 RepID=A0A521DXJ7_9FLAO|nr:outer membrane beta-barrel family protein [Flavobacterium nitrogenifigens]KAF2334016.1 TonB-dependent receptor [Flavobacterium nitrogenifigens]SMO76318.1 Outer membrane receptor proteins, mostly Fe transport [Flavobacterium nitrogenifigens]
MNLYLPLKLLITLLLFCLSCIANAQNETPKDSTSNQLDEIVISQEKKTFTNSNGNIKVDVANSVYSTIPNPVDLLSKLPSVQVSTDRESISIVGKGNPLIYIDGQKGTITDLNALSVADIKTIEIIKNPSSKYEAEGRAVILITRKLSKKDSFRTEISEVASFKKHYNNYLGFNSSFKKGKLEWKANFNYNKLNPWEKHTLEYEIPKASIISNYDVMANTHRNQYIFGGGMYYKIKEEDYFSINVNGKLQSDTFDINTFTFNQNQDVVNNVFTLSDNSSKKDFVNAFVNYSKKIKSIDTQLFAGFQYSNFNQHLKSLVANNYNETDFELSQNRDQKFNVDVFSGRVDLEKKFKNEMDLEYGALYLKAKSVSNADIFDFEKNSNEISDYDFKEENLAAYIQFSGKLKKIDFSFGLRAENTNVYAKFRTQISPSIDKNYTNLFPKANITFPIDSTKSIILDYAKSIVRPKYSSLSQIATYINPYFLYGSSINLGPAFVDEISSTIQYLDKTLKFGYYQTKDVVNPTFVFNEETNVLMITDINFKRETGFTIDLTLPFTYKFWTATNSLVFAKSKTEDDAALLHPSKPYLYYYSNNTFKLPKDFSFVLSFWGMTKQNDGIFERKANFIVDLSLAKTFGKNWSCTLNYNDIFKATTYTDAFSINNINSKFKYWVDANEISIAVRYSFGKIKDSEYKEKSVNESENRIR